MIIFETLSLQNLTMQISLKSKKKEQLSEHVQNLTCVEMKFSHNCLTHPITHSLITILLI